MALPCGRFRRSPRCQARRSLPARPRARRASLANTSPTFDRSAPRAAPPSLLAPRSWASRARAPASCRSPESDSRSRMRSSLAPRRWLLVRRSRSQRDGDGTRIAAEARSGFIGGGSTIECAAHTWLSAADGEDSSSSPGAAWLSVASRCALASPQTARMAAPSRRSRTPRACGWAPQLASELLAQDTRLKVSMEDLYRS